MIANACHVPGSAFPSPGRGRGGGRAGSGSEPVRVCQREGGTGGALGGPSSWGPGLPGSVLVLELGLRTPTLWRGHAATSGPGEAGCTTRLSGVRNAMNRRPLHYCS